MVFRPLAMAVCHQKLENGNNGNNNYLQFLILFVFRSADELFDKYDPSMVVFEPPIPVPKPTKLKVNRQKHNFVNKDFRSFCMETTRKRLRFDKNTLNFVV